MGKIRILIVDDHAILRQGIRMLLSAERNFKVIGEAGNGEEAVALAAQLSPDILLMDIAMPVMGGLEATRHITEAFPHVKIIVLSQHSDRQYVQSALKSGARGCIPKEAVSTDVVSAIRAVNQGETYLHRSMLLALMESEKSEDQPRDELDGLTPREIEVVTQIAQDYSNAEIAQKLYLSVNTVLNHKKRIMAKLNMHHRNEIVRYAMRKNLIAPDVQADP